MFKKAYIDSIREYVPEAARTILDEQVPKLRQQIDNDIKAFGETLEKGIVAEVDALVSAWQRETLADVGRIKELIGALKTNGNLTEATKGLKDGIDAFITKWSGLGEKVGAAVKSAAAKALAL